jgi:hypothetical protein
MESKQVGQSSITIKKMGHIESRKIILFNTILFYQSTATSDNHGQRARLNTFLPFCRIQEKSNEEQEEAAVTGWMVKPSPTQENYDRMRELFPDIEDDILIRAATLEGLILSAWISEGYWSKTIEGRNAKEKLFGSDHNAPSIKENKIPEMFDINIKRHFFNSSNEIKDIEDFKNAINPGVYIRYHHNEKNGTIYDVKIILNVDVEEKNTFHCSLDRDDCLEMNFFPENTDNQEIDPNLDLIMQTIPEIREHFHTEEFMIKRNQFFKKQGAYLIEENGTQDHFHENTKTIVKSLIKSNNIVCQETIKALNKKWDPKLNNNLLFKGSTRARKDNEDNTCQCTIL